MDVLNFRDFREINHVELWQAYIKQKKFRGFRSYCKTRYDDYVRRAAHANERH